MPEDASIWQHFGTSSSLGEGSLAKVKATTERLHRGLPLCRLVFAECLYY